MFFPNMEYNMPYYVFECEEHERFNIFQHINDNHSATCPECGLVARMVFTPPAVKTQPTKMGKTRNELFQNLGREGLAQRDMWKWDKNQREQLAKK